MDSAKTTRRGFLYDASRSPTCATNDACSTSFSTVPSSSTTTAVTASTHLASAVPTHGDLTDRRMRQECILDFTGVDVVSAADDHVRSSVLQEQESFGVELTDVTGVNPAVFGEGVRIQFRCI